MVQKCTGKFEKAVLEIKNSLIRTEKSGTSLASVEMPQRV